MGLMGSCAPDKGAGRTDEETSTSKLVRLKTHAQQALIASTCTPKPVTS